MKTSFVVMGALLTGAIAACTVKTTKNDPTTVAASSGAGASATTGTLAGPGPQSSSQSSSTGMMGCYDSAGAATLIDTIKDTANRAVCSKAQVDGFFTACIGMAATQMGCDAWIKDTNNMTCQGCMLYTKGDTHVPALLTIPDPNDMTKSYILPARLACQSLVEMQPACGAPLESLNYCDQSSCITCDPKDKTAFQTCVKDAEADGCKDALMKVTTTCQMVGSKGLSPKCDNADFITMAKAVVGTLCGNGM